MANSVTATDFKKAFPELILEVRGSESTAFSSADAPDRAKAGSLVFLSRAEAVETGLKSEASGLVVNKKTLDKVGATSKTVIVVPEVDLAMALIISKFFRATPYRDDSFSENHHPSAIIHPSAKVAATCKVSPGVVIAANVAVGENSFIGANSIIEKDVTIGSNTTIHPLVYIGHSTKIGNNCEVLPNTTIAKEGFGYGHDAKGNHYRIPHQGVVVIEDNVHVGANCSVDRGTFAESRIGAGTKIDNQVHLAHNSIVGKGCLLTARFAMAGSSKIGNFFIAGGSTNVTGHIEICDNVQVSGMSGVAKTITVPGAYGGLPLLPLQDHLKMKAAMVHLADMRKQLSKLMKQVFPGETEKN